MDLVLGVSITSAAVRLVLVEGATGEGDTVDREVIDIANVCLSATELLRNRVIAVAQDNTLHSIGVTWTAEAAADGSRVLEALATAGFEDFLAVSECDAADALAAGIAGLAGHDDVGVCIVEPDAAVVAVVNSQGALVDRIDRRRDGANALELVGTLVRMFDPGGWTPGAIFVFGSAEDLDPVVSMLRSAVSSPVVSAADADLALAKGAALSAARAMSGWEAHVAPIAVTDDAVAAEDDAPAPSESRGRWLSPRVGALTSVLAAAALTFVVSLSLALGLHLTPQGDSVDPPGVTNATGQPAMAAQPPVVESAPQPPAAAPPPAEKALPAAETVAAEAAPVPEAVTGEPVFEAPEAAPVAPEPEYVPAAPAPAPVYVPPAPAYVPPAPAPVYVPPNTPAYTPPPQPRLRDRIIERIPIINRFHEPQPYNP